MTAAEGVTAETQRLLDLVVSHDTTGVLAGIRAAQVD